MEKIIVIGSNSFSGAQFVDYALGQGLEAVAISRSPEPQSVFLPYKKRRDTPVRFFRFDLNLRSSHDYGNYRGFPPRLCVNLRPEHGGGELAESGALVSDQCGGNHTLHDQLTKCDFLKKYLHVPRPKCTGPARGVVRRRPNYSPARPTRFPAAADMS